jgi:hypothetical protein
VCSPLTLSLYAQQIPTSVAFIDAFFLTFFLSSKLSFFSCYASSFLRQLMLKKADFPVERIDNNLMIVSVFVLVAR